MANVVVSVKKNIKAIGASKGGMKGGKGKVPCIGKVGGMG